MWILIIIGVVAIAYSRANWQKIPSGLKVIAGAVLLHWLMWSLAPAWWESFYRTRAFWPINIGFAVFGWLAVSAKNEGGKKMNLVFKSVLGLATMIVLMAAWPSKKVVPPPSYLAPVAVSATAIDPALRVPLETAELIETTFGSYGDSVVTLMKRIACVESDCGIQFEPGDSTMVRRGRVNSNAVGIFQIMETLHAENCLAVGHDILTAEGNVGCARILYEESGTTPWEASRSLWEPWGTLSTTPASTATGVTAKCFSGELIVTAPAASDTAWSEKVLTCGRRLFWGESQSEVEVVMRDDTGRIQILPVGPESHWPYAPKWVQIRSTSNEPVEYQFERR